MSRTYAKYSNDIFIRGSFRVEEFWRIARGRRIRMEAGESGDDLLC